MAIGPGRPRLASRELLQEAAFELFQLHGYRATTVAQIARTAGFSRATFFHYFASKADLFWVETDALIERLQQHLEQQLEQQLEPSEGPSHSAGEHRTVPPELREAILKFAATISRTDTPWALEHYRLMGDATDDLIASGASRVQHLHTLFTHYVIRREAARNEGGNGGAPMRAASTGEPAEWVLRLRAEAAATAGALLVGLSAWIDQGSSRGALSETLARTLWRTL